MASNNQGTSPQQLHGTHSPSVDNAWMMCLGKICDHTGNRHA